MNETFKLCLNRASEMQIAYHLRLCDTFFVPSLSARVNINEYSDKISKLAMRFEAWTDSKLIGLLAAYCNDQNKRTAYITSLSVLPSLQKQGVASQLIENCIIYAKSLSFIRIELEVYRQNINAVNFYKKYGFFTDQINDELEVMVLLI